MQRCFLLCILDGIGINPRVEGNAFAQADTPILDRLLKSCPNTTLQTHGERVGLPAGQMGNSEVGHLNIGAGRVVEQWLFRIGRFLEKDSNLASAPAFQNWTAHLTGQVHICGLYSDGGVHSHLTHLLPVIRAVRSRSKSPILLHLFTDGRDTSPHSGLKFIKDLEGELRHLANVSIASISGRFFAMDRDNRWERVQKAYDAIVKGSGKNHPSASQGIEASYAADVTDEFIEPFLTNYTGAKEGDSFIFFNFREDRMRELTSALTEPSFSGFSRPFVVNSDKCLGFTQYGRESKIPVIFEHIEIRNYLGEYLSTHGVAQLRVAETEKYPHVTYFLNGGSEAVLPGEDRKLIPSPRDVATYDLRPEMSADGVTQAVIDGIRSRKYGLIVVNFANCDMVGHTGVLQAAIKAVETVDQSLGKILVELEKENGEGLILADHGNCEQMINYSDGTPHTSHTLYPVRLIAISPNKALKLSEGGALCDVAPTLLTMMGLKVPNEMTGRSLIAA